MTLTTLYVDINPVYFGNSLKDYTLLFLNGTQADSRCKICKAINGVHNHMVNASLLLNVAAHNSRPVPSGPGGDDGRMACMTAMMNMNRGCGSDPFGGIITQEMTPEQIRHKVIETDLSELCR